MKWQKVYDYKGQLCPDAIRSEDGRWQISRARFGSVDKFTLWERCSKFGPAPLKNADGTLAQVGHFPTSAAAKADAEARAAG